MKVIEQVVALFLLGIVGFIAAKKGFVPKGTGVYLSAVVVRITAPLLIFFTLAGYTFTFDVLKTGCIIYVLSLVFIAFSYLVIKFVCRFCNISQEKKDIMTLETMFGNVVYLAFPVLYLLFGSAGLVYGIFFNLANDSLLWTLGIGILSRHENQGVQMNGCKSKLKKLINANTVAFAGGLFVVAVKSTVGDVFAALPIIDKAIGIVANTYLELGKTTIYLSMVFIGLIMSEIQFNGVKDFFSRKYLFVFSFVKLVFIPAVALLVFWLIGNNLSKMVSQIITIHLALYCI